MHYAKTIYLILHSAHYLLLEELSLYYIFLVSKNTYVSVGS